MTSPTVLVPTRWILGVGVFTFLLFGGIAVLSNVFMNSTVSALTTGAFLGFAFAGLYLVLQFVRQRHVVHDDELEVASVLGRRWSLAWSDVTAVEYRASNRQFVLHEGSGRSARVSALASGIATFASIAIDRIPSDALNDEATIVLEWLAGGGSPYELPP